MAGRSDFSGCGRFPRIARAAVGPRLIPCERHSSGRELFPTRPYRAADISAHSVIGGFVREADRLLISQCPERRPSTAKHEGKHSPFSHLSPNRINWAVL